MKLQVEQAKEHIGKKFPYSYTISASELGDVTAFPWSRHDITINGEFGLMVKITSFKVRFSLKAIMIVPVV